jgi:hypothetical protein
MQAQYRPYAQQGPQRSPHVQNQRRGGIGSSNNKIQIATTNVRLDSNPGPMMSSGPHHSVPLTQAQLVQQQQAQAHASELAKRRSRRPTDKSMPNGVEDTIIEAAGVQRYKALRDLERRLDATMTRKRLDIVDSASRNAKVCEFRLICYDP